MIAAGVEDDLSKRPSGYWRDLVFSRLLPALFFSLFLARQVLFVWGGLHSLHSATDFLFLVQQCLALAYFTMLVVLYSMRLPARGTDHRLGVIFIAFTGTFTAIGASFLPGGGHRAWLVLPARHGRPRLLGLGPGLPAAVVLDHPGGAPPGYRWAVRP